MTHQKANTTQPSPPRYNCLHRGGDRNTHPDRIDASAGEMAASANETETTFQKARPRANGFPNPTVTQTGATAATCAEGETNQPTSRGKASPGQWSRHHPSARRARHNLTAKQERQDASTIDAQCRLATSCQSTRPERKALQVTTTHSTKALQSTQRLAVSRGGTDNSTHHMIDHGTTPHKPVVPPSDPAQSWAAGGTSSQSARPRMESSQVARIAWSGQHGVVNIQAGKRNLPVTFW